MHLGNNNRLHQNVLGGDTQLKNSSAEKELVISVGTKLNMSKQCAFTARKSNGVLINGFKILEKRTQIKCPVTGWDSGDKLKNRKFPHFFAVWVTVAQRGCRGNWAWSWAACSRCPYWSKGLVQITSRGTLSLNHSVKTKTEGFH